jgi:hypothetical protein
MTTMLNNLENDSIFTPEQVLENRGRVAIFIDGSNLFYAALQLGIEIDYTKAAGFSVVDATQRIPRYC